MNNVLTKLIRLSTQTLLMNSKSDAHALSMEASYHSWKRHAILPQKKMTKSREVDRHVCKFDPYQNCLFETDVVGIK